MKKVVVIATGQSLTDHDVEMCKLARAAGVLDLVIAISNAALDKASWADVLVSSDSNWFAAHPDYLNFKGRKFSKHGYTKTESYKVQPHIAGVNSGLLGLFVARDIYKAEKICLLGFDMHGTHYFGPHKASGFHALTNTSESRFRDHIKQFDLFTGAEVYNATEGSALKKYPFVKLKDFLNAD